MGPVAGAAAWALAAAVMAALGGGGCRQKKTDKKATVPVFLVSPQERDQLQESLLEALLHNGRLRCPRPVLRSTPAPGRADAPLRALLEPVGATARCFGFVGRRWDDLRRALFQDPPPTPGGVAGRVLSRAYPLTGRAEPALVAELRQRCAGLPALLEAAVQRADACSPYLPGRRRTPKVGTLLQVHLAAVALARQQFHASPREAAWLLLHTLRLGQDLCRGGTPWIWPLAARLGALDVVGTLRLVLAADRLSLPALDALAEGVARLAAAEPAPATHLLGERLSNELARYLIPLMPRAWIPPGGRPRSADDGAAPRAREARLRAFSGAIRQDLLLAWLASRRYARRLDAACRDTLTGWQCLAAVQAQEQRAAVRRRQLKERWQELARLAARGREGFDREATREAAVELLAGLASPNASSYLLQAAQRGFYLAALGLHVAVLRAARRGGWPGLAAVASWSKLRRDPFRDAPLQLQPLGAGFEVRPAAALRSTTNAPPVRYVIPGPLAGAPSRRAPATDGRGATGAPPGPRPRTR